MNENADPEELSSKLTVINTKYRGHENPEDDMMQFYIQPMLDMHLHSAHIDYDINPKKGDIQYVYLFLLIALAVLSLASINFMNLATARARGRAKEIGMRKALGAVKINIIRQFYSESIFLAFLALIAAVLQIMLFLPAFNALADKKLALDLTGSPSHIFGLLGITLFTGLLSGSYPALVLSSFKPVNILKTSLNSKSGKSLFRKVLVVSQFTAAIILTISTLMMFKQLNFIRTKNLGFNREHVLVIPVNKPLKQNYEAFKNQIKNYAGIKYVTTATNLPTQVGNINPVYWEGKTAEHYKTINWTAVDHDYFDTFEMEFAEGRKFSREFTTDKQNYIVNEAAASMMGFESAVGRMFSLWSNEGKIIGVVKNFHAKSLHSAITPIVFTMDPNWDWSLRNIFIKIKPDNIDETIKNIESAAMKFSPDYLFDYSFLDEHFDRQYRLDKRIGTIFQYFSFIAVFISCLGLFGLAAFMVQQRTKEISIRRVLGASKSYIMMLLSKEFLLLILSANLIAWPASWFVIRKLMESYAYKTDVTIWVFLTAGLAALILTFITISFQTYKAARTNPAETLRYE